MNSYRCGVALLGYLLAMTLVLSGCGQKMIKPEDKKVVAVYQFEMPDYEATPENVAKKTQQWLEKQENTTYLYTKDGSVFGAGSVRVKTYGEKLTTRFELQFKIISGQQVEMDVYHFKDEEGPRQGYSDRAYVFFNVIKDAVLDLGDEYVDYMESDTKPKSILDEDS